MNGKDFKLVASSLGRALEYARSTGLGVAGVEICIDNMALDFAAAFPLFDEARFREAVESVAAGAK